ncbi:MAG: ATP-binding cassette domain-containing protein [Alphaproteobacteria bacterium]|nr:ATP-binding cassette domain-containing protein [Alphaproteobacteria bacterium]
MLTEKLGSTHPFWKPLWLNRSAYRDIAVASVFLNLLALALPIFTRVVYDRVVPNFAEATLWVLLSGMVLVMVFEILFKASRAYISDHMGYLAGAQLEQQFHAHLLHLPQGVGVARAGQYFSNLQEIRDFFCQRLLPTLVDAPFVLAFLLAIFLLSPVMALVPLVVGGLVVGVQYAFHRVLHHEMAAFQQAHMARQDALVESLAGRDTIRQLACYTPFAQLWQRRTDEAAQRTAQLATWQGLMTHVTGALIILNAILLMVVGVYEIHANTLSVGGLLAVNLLSTRALTPLASIGAIAAKWPHMRSQMRTLERMLEQPAEHDEAAESFTLLGALAMQQVTVQYTGAPLPVLKEVSLVLPKGKKLALVGPSGAGKTTLLHTLSAEVPLQSGIVRWDEREISHLPPAQLRAQLAIVDQYPFFFARSLRDNLLMGLERDDADIRHALEMVGMDGFVKAQGQGLDLPISEGGANLSGGQRQCLAIARALLRQAPVLLMDEPTSMMDHMMEARVVNNLTFALKDKTLVVVTHRTPLLALVDMVGVLDGGRLTRYGPRADVLKELGAHGNA